MPAIDLRTWSKKSVPLFDEENARMHYRRNLLDKLMSVFEWTGLDEDVPITYIESALLINGVCGFMKHNGKVIPVICWGAEAPDEYYRCKNFTWAQPALGSGTIPAEQVVYNDNLAPWFGWNCKDIIDKYADLLASTDISLKIAIKNSRLTHVFVTDNQQDVKNINDMVNTVANGGLATAIYSDTLVGDGAKLLEATTKGTDYMRQLSETREYLYNCFLSEFGIHANTVLKRERELTGEIDMQIEKPTFNVWGMLKARQEGAKRLSKLFDMDITVDFSEAITIVEDEITEGEFDENSAGKSDRPDDGEAEFNTEEPEPDTTDSKPTADNGDDEPNEQQSEPSDEGASRAEPKRDGPTETAEGVKDDESETDGVDTAEQEAEQDVLSEGSEEAEQEDGTELTEDDEPETGNEVSDNGVTININIKTEEGDVNADLETAQPDGEPDAEEDVQEDSDDSDDDTD